MLNFYGEEKGKVYYAAFSDPRSYKETYTASVHPIYVQPKEKLRVDPNIPESMQGEENTMYILYLDINGKPVERPNIAYPRDIVVPDNVYCMKVSYRTGTRPTIKKYF